MAGSGDRVVLLHGWPQTSHEWRRVIPLLARRHRVIAPDLWGLGDTSRPQDGYDAHALTVVDVTSPGIGPDISRGGKRWHHAFHTTPDLPQARWSRVASAST